MRVRVRKTAAGPWGIIMRGGSGIVPDEIGRAMIAAREAVEVASEAEPYEEPTLIMDAETATAEPEQETTAFAPPKRRRARRATV